MGFLLPEIRTWAQWGQMFTDVELWAPVVREICRQASIRFERIEAGLPGTNAVFVLDRDRGKESRVVKIYAPFCHGDYELECDLYPLLARCDGVPAPRLLQRGVWHDRIDWPYIVMDYLPGRPIGEVRDEIDAGNRIEIAAHLGRILRELHAVPLARVRALDVSREGWLQFLQTRRESIAGELAAESALSPGLIDGCVALLEARWGDIQGRLALLNGDVTADHVLVERRDGAWRISGLIDFADAVVGQVEYEWVAVWFDALSCEPASMAACMAHYDPEIRLDASFVERAMAYTLLHEFGAGIIRTSLERLGDPELSSVQELERVLWGALRPKGST